jgi:hypothetical protein
MVTAHILGIPVEETALAFAPAFVLFLVGVRLYGREAGRKLRAGAQREMQKTDV